MDAGLDRDDVPRDGECNDDTNNEITYDVANDGEIIDAARAAYGYENADDGMRATTWGVGEKDDDANDEDDDGDDRE